jgi:hypothetical protein
MLFTTPALSDAILNLCSARSLASASPSLTAIASKVSGPDIPITTTDEAPKNCPVELRATAAYTAFFEFFDIAASTLIFISPGGGGNHLGGFDVTFTALTADCSATDSKS